MLTFSLLFVFMALPHRYIQSFLCHFVTEGTMQHLYSKRKNFPLLLLLVSYCRNKVTYMVRYMAALAVSFDIHEHTAQANLTVLYLLLLLLLLLFFYNISFCFFFPTDMYKKTWVHFSL